MTLDVAALADGVRRGDRRSLAKAITLVESTRHDHRAGAADLLDALLGATGASVRIGISGSPGVGKSTFIEAFGLHLRATGHRVAVLAVDPSSSLSGGSILGDKTRMGELAADPEVFVRPSPGSGHLGGVARRTREALLLCEAAGFDVVIVETIGVGQSETEIAEMVDAFVLLVGPGAGDELQGIKRGIMELADLIVVNKADGDLAAAASRTRADYANAVHLLRPKWSAWSTRAVTCSAVERRGIAEVWDELTSFAEAVTGSGELSTHRAAQAVAWLWSELRDDLVGDFRSAPAVQALLPDVERAVASGDLSARAGARRLLDAFRS